MREDFENYTLRYGKDLTRLCLSLCGNSQDAEDLFQETWCRAIRNYAKYNSSMPFDKWLFAICVNTYKNSVGLFYNKKRIHFKSDEEKTAFLNSIPDANEDNSDDYIELHGIISSLPKKLKIVIALYYFKDYGIRDIAQLLKIPEGTVKSRLHNAKAEIKRRLEIYEKQR